MEFSLYLVISLASIAWMVWRVARWYLTASPLDNIDGPPCSSILTGNLGHFLDSKRGFDYHQEISDKYGSVSRIHGPFGARALYVFDPKALRSLLLNQQAIFEPPSWILARNRMIFGLSLVGTVDEKHRRQRQRLNPAFSAQNLRLLMPEFYDVAHRLRKGIATEMDGPSGEIDVLGWTARASLEAIAHSGFGYSFDSFAKSKTRHPFLEALKDFVPALSDLDIFLPVVAYLERLGSSAFRRRLVEMMPLANVQRMKRILDTIEVESQIIIRQKLAEAQEVQNESSNANILSVLSQEDRRSGGKLSEEEITSQMSTLVFAGTDSTSNALARTLQLLSEHQEVQDRLRAELMAESRSGDMSYDRLAELPYLDAVCRETLRLDPPAPFSLREASADTTLPLSQPILGLDGKMLDAVPAPKGTMILISILSCNRNKAVWGEDALEWEPERWLSPLPDSVSEARIPGIHSNLLTFMAGGRSCIGFNFAQLEMKVILSVLITSFKFSPTTHKVVWNMGGVNFPTSEEYSSRVCLPLKMETVLQLV